MKERFKQGMKELWELYMFEKDLVYVSEVHYRHKFSCDLKEIKIQLM